MLRTFADDPIAEEAEWQAAGDREHAEWLASGEADEFPKLLTNWQAKRAGQRATAEAEWDALCKQMVAANGDDDLTVEQETAFEIAFDLWHAKYDHLFPRVQLSVDTRTPEMSVVPFPLQANAESLPDLIKTSGEFVRDFTPPEYIVDGVLQSGFFYSLTAQTGVGKTTVAMLTAGHVSLGRSFGPLEVAQGSVLYFAGENPTDIRMRWLGLTQELGIDCVSACKFDPLTGGIGVQN